MTIQIVFKQASQRVAVRIIGDSILFIDLESNVVAPIEGLKLSKKGVIKEHPDLEGNKEWKQIAIQRFVDKIKQIKSEKEKEKWIIKEMEDMNYTPLYKQKNGFRPKKI